MKKLFLTLISILLFSNLYAQSPTLEESNRVKDLVINFLQWYKKNEAKLESLPILTGFNEDYTKKTDSVVKVDDRALGIYLNNLKKSNYLSSNFIGTIKSVYDSVGVSLKRKPLTNYFGPIPELEADLIFGFEPDETLNFINKIEFINIVIIANKALVRFRILKHDHRIVALTKVENDWLIDYIGFDTDYYSSQGKRK